MAAGDGGGDGGGNGNGSNCSALHVIVRDFVGVGCTAPNGGTPHPDFEHAPSIPAGGNGLVPNIVEAMIRLRCSSPC